MKAVYDKAAFSFIYKMEVEKKRIGAEITKDYADKEPLVVCVLKGSLPFHAELINIWH